MHAVIVKMRYFVELTALQVLYVAGFVGMDKESAMDNTERHGFLNQLTRRTAGQLILCKSVKSVAKMLED